MDDTSRSPLAFSPLSSAVSGGPGERPKREKREVSWFWSAAVVGPAPKQGVEPVCDSLVVDERGDLGCVMGEYTRAAPCDAPPIPAMRVRFPPRDASFALRSRCALDETHLLLRGLELESLASGWAPSGDDDGLDAGIPRCSLRNRRGRSAVTALGTGRRALGVVRWPPSRGASRWVIRTGLLGGSIPWKRGWSHGNRQAVKEPLDAALQPG
jgi:hypothetical protein